MAKQTFTTGQVLTAAQVNSLQTNDFNQTVSAKTASYVLVASDKGTRIEFNTSGSVTCTVNTGIFDAGDTLIVQNRGAGAVTITAGTATVNTSGSLVVNQYESGTLYFISASAALWFGSNPGDITGITTGASSGLTGGVTSGTADLKLNTAAKGDLLVGTGAGTVSALSVGANGTTLVADSAQSTGLKWAAASSGGLTLITPTSTTNSGGSVATSGGAVTFTGVTSVSLNGVFTSTYANYLIVVSELTGNGNAALNLRFRVSGTDSSTGYYAGGFYVLYTSSTVNGESTSNGTSFDIAAFNTSPSVGSIIYVQNPQLAKSTAIQAIMSRTDAAGYRTGYHSVTTAYDGLTFLAASGSTTGVVRVYGLSN